MGNSSPISKPYTHIQAIKASRLSEEQDVGYEIPSNPEWKLYIAFYIFFSFMFVSPVLFYQNEEKVARSWKSYSGGQPLSLKRKRKPGK